MQTLKNNKCLTCGGDIILSEDGNHGECSFCHRRYEYESGLTDDKSIIDYKQAMEYWHTFKFADAKRKFLEVANKNPEFSEAWWGAFVSEYGIEFVTNKFGGQIPTCHRAHTVSVFDDENYKKAIETADDETKETYHSLGEKIETIRKGIIEKSNAGEIYDIFICFKATEVDDERRKTMDYDLGEGIYSALIKKGYRVFFAPETLLQVAEQEYEPYIYRALSTAKVMLLLCSDNREIESAWVKNEWSRFLDMHNGQGLIPICGNRFEPYSPNTLPEELRKLNAIEFDANLYDKIYKKLRPFFIEKSLLNLQKDDYDAENQENCDELIIETFEAGVDAFNNKDYKTAFALYKQAAQKHYAPAEYNVGDCYANGIGVEESIEDAVKWYRKSAEQNYSPALCVLADYYDKGDWLEKDEEKATNLYLRAAKNGDEDAIIELANRYDDGIGTIKNEKEAAKWYRKAAEKGNAYAQCIYACECLDGIGVSKNSAEAVKWFHKSAEQGQADAQYMYACCCLDGNGTEKNHREALIYFKKAADQGHADATYKLSKFYKGIKSYLLKKRARELGCTDAKDEAKQKKSRKTILIPIISSVSALIIMFVCALAGVNWNILQWIIGGSTLVILGTIYFIIVKAGKKADKWRYISTFIVSLNILFTGIFKAKYFIISYWVKAATLPFCIYKLVCTIRSKKWGVLWDSIVEIIELILPISLVNFKLEWTIYQWIIGVVAAIILGAIYVFLMLFTDNSGWIGLCAIPIIIISAILMINFEDKYTIISYWVNGITLLFIADALIASIGDGEGWWRIEIIMTLVLILLIFASAFNITWSTISQWFSNVWNNISRLWNN